jgi:hypothetical protein
MHEMVERSIENFQNYFGQAVEEIRNLRTDLGEVQWSNRELKIAVKEKSYHNRILIEKIERFEVILKKLAAREQK